MLPTAAVWYFLQGPFIASCSLSRSMLPAPPPPPLPGPALSGTSTPFSRRHCVRRTRPASWSPPADDEEAPAGDEEVAASPELPRAASERQIASTAIERPSVLCETLSDIVPFSGFA